MAPIIEILRRERVLINEQSGGQLELTRGVQLDLSPYSLYQVPSA